MGKKKEWLEEEVKRQGFASVRHVFFAALNDHDHTLYIDNGKGKRNKEFWE